MLLDAVDLGAENDARLARLREALVLGEGFQLLVVQVEPGEQREEVLRRLSGWSGRHGVPTLELVRLSPGESPMTRLGTHPGVVLVGLEAEPDSPVQRFREVIAELNWSRDRLPQKVHGPLVLVVSQRVQSALFEQAPDFYSWRSHTTNIAGVRVAVPVVAHAFRGRRSDAEDPTVLGALIEEASALQPLPTLYIGVLRARMARAWLRQGNVSAAETALDAAEMMFGSAASTDDRLDLLLLRKEVAIHRGQMAEASQWHERARQEAASGTPSPSRAALLLFEAASLASARRDKVAAEASLRDAIRAFDELGDHRAGAELQMVLASLDPAGSARATLERALESARQADDPAMEANVLIALARDARCARRSDDAEQYARDAVARAGASESPDTIAIAGTTLGEIALDNGNRLLAREALSATLQPERVHLAGDVAAARGRLALCDRDDVSAQRYFLKAAEAYRLHDPERRGAAVSLALGEIAGRTGELALAMAAFEIAARLGNDRVQAMSARGRAMLAFNAGERTTALAERLSEVTRLFVGIGDATLADESRTTRGVVLAALGRFEDARRELTTAYTGYDNRGQASAAADVERLLEGVGSRTD